MLNFGIQMTNLGVEYLCLKVIILVKDVLNVCSLKDINLC